MHCSINSPLLLTLTSNLLDLLIHLCKLEGHSDSVNKPLTPSLTCNLLDLLIHLCKLERHASRSHTPAVPSMVQPKVVTHNEVPGVRHIQVVVQMLRRNKEKRCMLKEVPSMVQPKVVTHK